MPSPNPALSDNSTEGTRAVVTRLADQVNDLANTTYALARRIGRLDLTAQMQAQATRLAGDADTAVAVVVGDIKRGKSTLINTLIGHDGLLPVDADVATSARLLVRYAERPYATVTRVGGAGGDGDGETVEVGLADLPRYASEQGDPGARAGVSQVEVGVPHPLLERGLAVLDTPGFGSMTRGHRATTLAALGTADVLLFVLSADGPVLRSELDFLAEAAGRVATIGLLLSKIDLNPEWPEMLSANRDRITAYADELRGRPGDAGQLADRIAQAPILPVSSRFAATARERAAAGRADSAARMRVRSGFDELSALLDGAVAARERLRAATALQMVGYVLGELDSDRTGVVRSTERDEGVDHELAQQQAELERLASDHAGWRRQWHEDVEETAASATRTLTRELNAVSRHYVTGLRAGELRPETVAGDLRESLLAAWTTVSTAIAADLGNALEATTARLGTDRLRISLDELLPPDAIRAVRPASSRPARFDVAGDGLPALMTTSVIGTLVGAVLPILAGPPGWIAGALVAGGITLARRSTRMRAQDADELAAALADLHRECAAEIVSRLRKLRRAFEEEIGVRTTDTVEQLGRRRRELAELRQIRSDQRESTRLAAEQDLVEIRAVGRDADWLRATTGPQPVFGGQ